MPACVYAGLLHADATGRPLFMGAPARKLQDCYLIKSTRTLVPSSATLDNQVMPSVCQRATCLQAAETHGTRFVACSMIRTIALITGTRGRYGHPLVG